MGDASSAGACLRGTPLMPKAFERGWYCHGRVCSSVSLTVSAGSLPSAVFKSQVLRGFPGPKCVSERGNLRRAGCWYGEQLSPRGGCKTDKLQREDEQGRGRPRTLVCEKGGKGGSAGAAEGQKAFGEEETGRGGSRGEANEAAEVNRLLYRNRERCVGVGGRGCHGRSS